MARYRCPVCKQPCESSLGCFRHKPRTPIKKSGRKLRKLRNMEKVIDEKATDTRMWDLFCKIWKDRGPWSELDGAYLGKVPRTVFFDHLMPKETFPEVKYEEWNILMVTWDQHNARHNGFASPKHMEEIKKAISIYNKLYNL